MAAKKKSENDLREMYTVRSEDGVPTVLKLSPKDAKRYEKAGAKKARGPQKIGVARANKAGRAPANKAASK